MPRIVAEDLGPRPTQPLSMEELRQIQARNQQALERAIQQATHNYQTAQVQVAAATLPTSTPTLAPVVPPYPGQSSSAPTVPSTPAAPSYPGSAPVGGGSEQPIEQGTVPAGQAPSPTTAPVPVLPPDIADALSDLGALFGLPGSRPDIDDRRRRRRFGPGGYQHPGFTGDQLARVSEMANWAADIFDNPLIQIPLQMLLNHEPLTLWTVLNYAPSFAAGMASLLAEGIDFDPDNPQHQAAAAQITAAAQAGATAHPSNQGRGRHTSMPRVSPWLDGIDHPNAPAQVVPFVDGNQPQQGGPGMPILGVSGPLEQGDLGFCNQSLGYTLATVRNANVRGLPRGSGSILRQYHEGSIVCISAVTEYPSEITGDYRQWYRLADGGWVWGGLVDVESDNIDNIKRVDFIHLPGGGYVYPVQTPRALETIEAMTSQGVTFSTPQSGAGLGVWTLRELQMLQTAVDASVEQAWQSFVTDVVDVTDPNFEKFEFPRIVQRANELGVPVRSLPFTLLFGTPSLQRSSEDFANAAEGWYAQSNPGGSIIFGNRAFFWGEERTKTNPSVPYTSTQLVTHEMVHQIGYRYEGLPGLYRQYAIGSYYSPTLGETIEFTNINQGFASAPRSSNVLEIVEPAVDAITNWILGSFTTDNYGIARQDQGREIMAQILGSHWP